MKCIELNKINFGADRYFKIIKKSKIICVDFDNTVCLDEWPFIGPIIPGAIEVLRALEKGGHKLILYTQRSSHYPICCKELYEYSIINPYLSSTLITYDRLSINSSSITTR